MDEWKVQKLQDVIFSTLDLGMSDCLQHTHLPDRYALICLHRHYDSQVAYERWENEQTV